MLHVVPTCRWRFPLWRGRSLSVPELGLFLVASAVGAAIIQSCACLPGHGFWRSLQHPVRRDIVIVEAAGGLELYYEGEAPMDRAAASLRASWYIRRRPGLFLPAIRVESYRVTGRLLQPVEREMTAAEVDSWRSPLVRFLVEKHHPITLVSPLLLPDHGQRQVHWLAIFADGMIVTLPLWLVFRQRAIRAHRASLDTRFEEALLAGRCPRCGYDIRGLPQPRCPECGAVWPTSD